jgi:RNA polymerase sigma-70 factor (ECF subfamily)
MAELYDRYSSVVYGVALRVLQDAAAAEDALQDIFLQLWRRPDAFDSSRGSLAAWLAVIARHRAIDRLRQCGRRPTSKKLSSLAGRICVMKPSVRWSSRKYARR